MDGCVFCKIIKGEIPSLKVYENDDVVAFLDITPVSVGHTLVVPKEHYRDLDETPEEVLGTLFAAVKKIGSAVIAMTGSHAYNVGVNTGVPAGQVVMHVHVHVIPRAEGDGLTHWPKRKVTAEEMSSAAEKLHQALG
jgi:histidine triad (HIT) family protein